MDPATMAMMAQGVGQISKGMSAAPAVSSTAPQNASVYVEGMQIPGQAASGYASLMWPAALAVVALVWLRSK